MIDGLEHKEQLNSEVEKYKNFMIEEQRPFDFVKIGFNVDMREAQVRYKEEWRGDIGGIKTSQVPFSQWLDMKKFEATKFYLKHSDYYLGFSMEVKLEFSNQEMKEFLEKRNYNVEYVDVDFTIGSYYGGKQYFSIDAIFNSNLIGTPSKTTILIAHKDDSYKSDLNNGPGCVERIFGLDAVFLREFKQAILNI